MTNNRIKLYWLLLSVLIFTASLLTTIGESQARYVNAVASTTVVESKLTGITSNCLVTEGDVPLTVLVGELPLYESTKVSFWLKSSGEDAEGKLAWSVSDPDHVQYLNVTMSSGPDRLDSGAEIKLLEDAKMDITMSLMPTERARTVVHETLKINVLVTWGDEMWGTFQVILPAVVGPEETTAPTGETTAPTGETTAPTGETTAPTGETTAPTGETTAPSGETTAPTGETTANNVNGGESGDSQNQTALTSGDDDTTTGNGENTQTPSTGDDTTNTGENSGTGDGNTNTGEGSGTPSESTTASSTETSTESYADIGMATIKSFAQAEALPLKIVLTKDVTEVKLGLWVEETVEETAEDGTVTETTKMVMHPFPEGTRFSLNGGGSYYMLTDGRILELMLEDVSELSVLLDFSHAKLTAEEKLILAMEAWAGEVLAASRDASTVPDVTDLCQILTHSLVQTAEETEVTEATETTETTETTEPASTAPGWESRVLNQSNYLELVLPLHWWDADLKYTVDILTMTEAGVPEYRPVTLSAEGLSAKRTNYGGVHNLVFQIGEKLPQAGTYRVTMTWEYKGICFAEMQTTFFINYSALTAYTLGS